MNETSATDGSHGLMIGSVAFRNFKVLRRAMLPLGWFTLLIGPNGSGKSTAIQALEAVSRGQRLPPERFASVGSDSGMVELSVRWQREVDGLVAVGDGLTVTSRSYSTRDEVEFEDEEGRKLPEGDDLVQSAIRQLKKIRSYSLDANAIASPAAVMPEVELRRDGGNLAAVLDRMHGQWPEQFDALNDELSRWLPEFDRVTFEVPAQGAKSLSLRRQRGKHLIPAQDLSQGTLIALAILTLAYLPVPPSLVCVEEPDRGIHPRLLRRVRDALYRLSYPRQAGESREPVQVLATTHSPYFLDLFREHPEEVVIARRQGDDAVFERLVERSDIDEILEGVQLGEAWYSGVLGGVPTEE
jgi:predicted ATPase